MKNVSYSDTVLSHFDLKFVMFAPIQINLCKILLFEYTVLLDLPTKDVVPIQVVIIIKIVDIYKIIIGVHRFNGLRVDPYFKLVELII